MQAEHHYMLRYVDDAEPQSPFMSISCALSQGLNGQFIHWELIETYLIDVEIPQVLRVIAEHTSVNGLTIVDHDNEFESFLNLNNIDLPESPEINYLKSQNSLF